MDEVLPSVEVIALLQSELPLVPLQPTQPGETAQRWGYAGADGRYDPALGEIGVISSVTQAFCSSCNRARLSTEGQLYLHLFAEKGYDLRHLLRGEASNADWSTPSATSGKAEVTTILNNVKRWGRTTAQRSSALK